MNTKEKAGHAPALGLLRAAEAMLSDAIEEFQRLIEQAKRAEPLAETEARRIIERYRAAVLHLFKERNRVAEFAGHEERRSGNFSLDLEAARAEIADRLARLKRAAEPSGGI